MCLCPISITTELFHKSGYDFNASDNVRDILYDTDVINPGVKLIIHSPVGRLIYIIILINICFFPPAFSPFLSSNITWMGTDINDKIEL